MELGACRGRSRIRIWHGMESIAGGRMTGTIMIESFHFSTKIMALHKLTF